MNEWVGWTIKGLNATFCAEANYPLHSEDSQKDSLLERNPSMVKREFLYALAGCHILYFIAAALNELTTKEFFINYLGTLIFNFFKKWSITQKRSKLRNTLLFSEIVL